jgi:hypothetical protein
MLYGDVTWLVFTYFKQDAIFSNTQRNSTISYRNHPSLWPHPLLIVAKNVVFTHCTVSSLLSPSQEDYVQNQGEMRYSKETHQKALDTS